MVKRLHLPNVIGCAFGFAMAGSGIGSVMGPALEHWLVPPLPEGQEPIKRPLEVMYGGIIFGIKMGLVVGAIAGVLYALIVRRSRLPRQVNDA